MGIASERDIDSENLLKRLDRLNELGVALSAEKDTNILLERILLGAKEITGADGGTLYSVIFDQNREKKALKFEILRNDTLKIAMGGANGVPLNFPDLPLHAEDGKPNEQMIAAYAVLRNRTINVQDAYEAEGFDFSGTRDFDAKTGYRSKSFLTVPMKDHTDEIIGVVQLINKLENGAIVTFCPDDQQLVESLASQAAVALTNKRLIEELKGLFNAFIRLVASAIDEKSPYTGGHCRRVQVVTLMLADAVAGVQEGPFAEFSMTEEERYELEIAAWLHDCGKVTTPEYVVDKATKLETIYDRIHEVETRFEILRRDAEIAVLRQKLRLLEEGKVPDDAALTSQLNFALNQLDETLAFVKKANIGGEYMDGAAQERIAEIGRLRIRLAGEDRPLLSENEIANLNIPKGTLTDEERQIINNHVSVTIKMLEALPFPKNLCKVPEFAGEHHERVDGKGYPRGLTSEQMFVQARCLGIADIFEALTARDRPYRQGKKLSEALKIMGFMRKEGHIDPDLFDIFVREKVYQRYAQEYLDPDQSDEVDPAKIPGYGG